MPDEKKKKARVTNAQLLNRVDELEAQLDESQLQVVALQQALVRVVGEWDSQLLQLRGSTQELAIRVTTITDSISDTVEAVGVAED